MLKSKLFVAFLAVIASFTLAFMPQTPNSTIMGTVTDANGGILAGVNIAVKGTKTQTVSGNDGKYTLKLAAAHYTLVYAFAGYTTVEKQITLINQQYA
jgi:CarboxypepD_reg-like domain